jgi:cytochrome P450
MRRDRVDFYARTASDLGSPFVMRLGLLRLVVLTDPGQIHEVLVERPGDYDKSVTLSLFAEPLLGKGLLTNEAELHQKQRRMVAPAFSPKRLAGYAETMIDCAEQSASRMIAAGRVDLSEELMRATLDIVGRTLFDVDLTRDAEAVGPAITQAMQALTAQFYALLPLPPPVPTPYNRRLGEAVKVLDKIVFRIIEERRSSPGDRGDVLSILLAAQDDDGAPMSDKQLRDEVMTLFLAGHETTANAVTWALYLLGRHPDVGARARDEVIRAVGDRRLTFADLKALPFCLQVFKEALRLYPPAHTLSRVALRDTTIAGERIAKGQIVVMSPYAMHRRAEFFADPTRFDPDRFLPEREAAQVKHAFLPFGAGPRVCVGNHFAMMEGQLLLAVYLQRLQTVLERPEPAQAETLITLRPKGGVPVTVGRA